MADRCACGISLESRLGRAYNEEAFRYFLAIERKRNERSGRPFLLLLTSFREESGARVRIDPAVARSLFKGLWLCLRDTDYIGWYREHRIAGALMVEFQDGSRREAADMVVQRVTEALRDHLPSSLAHRLRLRVYQQPAPAGAELIPGEN